MTAIPRKAGTGLIGRSLFVLGLLGATVAVAPTASAVEPDPAPVTNASFVWGLNGYSQKGVFGPWTYSEVAGNAQALVGSVTPGATGTQTEYLLDPVPATSFPAELAGKTPNAIKFVGGVGTADPSTGAATISWSGSYTINAYPDQYGAPDEVYANPQLTSAADGSGQLTMNLTIGAGKDMQGNPVPATDLGRVTLATFDPGSVARFGSDGFRFTPDYQGVQVQTSGSPQATNCAPTDSSPGWWGSWPSAFVSAVPEWIRPHFYSTGCGGMNDFKPALPIDVQLAAKTTTTKAKAAISLDQKRVAYAKKAPVRVVVAGSPTPTGEVTLRDGAKAIGTATLQGGKARFNLRYPKVGSHQLNVEYSGDGSTDATESAHKLKITKADSSLKVKVTKQSKTKGPRIAAMVPLAKRGKVTVLVRSQNTQRATKSTLQRSSPLTKGKAAVLLPRLEKGRYAVTVKYTGDKSVKRAAKKLTLRVG